jgi:NADPH-dependent curcumin reductase CurA
MKQIVLKHKISAAPTAKDFIEIDVEKPICPDAGVVVEVKYISVDPYVGHQLHKGHMAAGPPAPQTDMIPGGIVGEVVESHSTKAKVGDHIHAPGAGGWAEYVALHDDQYTVVDPKAAPLSAYAGVLGMPGLTAWASVTQLARVQKGDVFAVNAAAGPVGGACGQFARMKGAKTVIGIAGGPKKCKLVKEVYGFDECVNYKTKDWKETFKAATPEGVSVHHENVGAGQLAFAMQNLQLYGRVVLCGLAAHYHDPKPAMTLIGPMVGKRAQVSGLVVYDFYGRWEEFRAEVAPWVKSGKVTIVDDKVKGLKNAPKLMEKLMAGKNVGKCVVEL